MHPCAGHCLNCSSHEGLQRCLNAFLNGKLRLQLCLEILAWIVLSKPNTKHYCSCTVNTLMRTMLKYLITEIKAKNQMHLLASATGLKLTLCPCAEPASTALCGPSACFPKEVWIQQQKGTVQAKSWKVLAQQLPRGCEDQGELREGCCLPSTTPGSGWGRI